MTTFYIVRHGETEYNIAEIMQGWVDSPLTKKGENQAKKAGKYLSNIHLDRCVSSDLGRVVQTAKLILGDRNIPLSTDSRLREVNFGIYDGALIKDVPLKDYRTRIEYDWTEFKGETYDMVGNRVAHTLEELAVNYPNESILITAHSGAIMSLIKHYDYNLYDSLVSVENKIRNCSTTILEINNSQPIFKLVNYDAYMHD